MVLSLMPAVSAIELTGPIEPDRMRRRPVMPVDGRAI